MDDDRRAALHHIRWHPAAAAGGTAGGGAAEAHARHAAHALHAAHARHAAHHATHEAAEAIDVRHRVVVHAGRARHAPSIASRASAHEGHALTAAAAHAHAHAHALRHATAEERAEDVLGLLGRHAAATAEAGGVGPAAVPVVAGRAAAGALLAVLVVHLPLLVIGERAVCLGDLLEDLLGVLVLVLVRVVLQGQLLVGLADLSVRGAALEAQDLVVVLGVHVRSHPAYCSEGR
mmetsp:Transcript_12325/g.31674  ORF Transcript_12325/g.31674 Transcript_12325/m.31674 type:complete len:234 (-) Transcript_12325:54-755(-)